MKLTSVIQELEEQLRFARDVDNPGEESYAAQLEQAINLLKEHDDKEGENKE